jgi:hypothetical protein
MISFYITINYTLDRHHPVIPANTGVHISLQFKKKKSKIWIPNCTEMTEKPKTTRLPESKSPPCKMLAISASITYGLFS